jgi:hypothetical protein
MAKMNGEDPKWWWVHINPVSLSTKEMGLSAHLDTIDNHAHMELAEDYGYGYVISTYLG